MTLFDNNTLISLCNSMAGASVLVVGDVMLDRFVYGSVNRISPESPVPVLVINREESMLGGAGNTLASLRSLGAQARIIAVTGDDAESANIKSQLDELKVSTETLITDSSRPTSIKTRFLAGHQQLLRSDFEKTVPIADDIAAAIQDMFIKELPNAQAVILSDYGKGVLRPDLIQTLIGKAAEQGVPVIVDPKGQDFSIYKGATALTPNKKELTEATNGHAVETDADIEAAAAKLIESCGIDAVIATRSADGMSVITKDTAPHHIRQAQDIQVFDVSGAGDTVIATIAAAIASGASLQDAATLANHAGSIAVTKVGTAPVRAEEIINILKGNDMTQASTARTRMAPLSDIETAQEDIKRWRAEGLKIGFTNGCFDIVHAGHVSYLNEARSQCDRLILGLNSDSSVSILKGPERPIHDEAARATVLGALASVDMVVLFGAKQHGDDNTAIKLLETLKPDIYFKGGDCQIDEIPETPTVRAYGGEVHVLCNVEGYSTTNAIEKIKKDA